MIVSVIFLCVCIILSATFSSAETSFMSLSPIKIRQLIKNRAKNAKLIQKLKSKQDKLITTILVGNNLVNNFASALGTSIAITFLGDAGVGIAAAVMTFVILIFGEIVPKTVAASHPSVFAGNLAKIVRFLNFTFACCVYFSIIIKSVTAFIKYFSRTNATCNRRRIKNAH